MTNFTVDIELMPIEYAPFPRKEVGMYIVKLEDGRHEMAHVHQISNGTSVRVGPAFEWDMPKIVAWVKIARITAL